MAVSAPAAPLPPQSASRRGVLGLVVIEALFVLLAGLYSLVTPLFEGPDEVWHYAFADYLAQGKGLPVLQASGQDIRLRNAAHPPLYHLILAAVIAPVDRRDFPDAFRFNLASPNITPGSFSDRPNLFIHTAHEDFPYRQSALAVHLARLVSVALGALTVLGVWRAARLIFLGDETLAQAATALAVFIPQFVYGTSLINNDALATAGATWLVVTLIQLMEVLPPSHRPGLWLAAVKAGAVLGVTLLSKAGMIAMLPVPAAALGLAAWRALRAEPGRHSRLRAAAPSAWAGMVLYGVAAAIAGWWYVRNWVLYGDPLAWRQWEALAGVGHMAPSLGGFAYAMVNMFGTFWADFSLHVDRQSVGIFALVILAALGGLARRTIRRNWPALHWPGLALAVLCFALLFAAAARYSFEIIEIHGRLLYPALAAVGAGLALGLTGWGGLRVGQWSFPHLGKWLAGGVAALLVGVNCFAPLGLIAPAYARPVLASATLPKGVTPASIRFGSLVELVGYRLVDERVVPGATAHVQLYWKSLAQAPHQVPDTFGSVTLTQPDGKVVGGTEVRLGTSVYPSSEWPPGEIVVAEVAVPVGSDAAAPLVAAVSVGVRETGASALTPSTAGETAALGRVVVRPGAAAKCAISEPMDATFGEAIRLVGYRAEPYGVILCWQAVQPVSEDYTVFVHMFDAGGQPVGGADAPPRSGNYPTSAWEVGEQVQDLHLLALNGGYVTVGLYRLDTGERLTLDGTGETEFKIAP